MEFSERVATPSDFDWITGVVDSWWGRPVSVGLPRLFLDHFYSTSLISESSGQPVGFLIGFHSPSQPSVAYVHYVGVDPNFRRRSIGKSLYESFFAMALGSGRREIRAITPSTNLDSISFHRLLGFDVSPPLANYNGRESEFVIFSRLV